LRAGPLSEPKLIDYLNAEFVNTWVVLAQLEKPEQYFTSSGGQHLAKAVLKHYVYPVQTQVYSPQGNLLGHLPVEKLMTAPFETWPIQYRQCLEKALGQTRSKEKSP
jgi:hypothetical protein